MKSTTDIYRAARIAAAATLTVLMFASAGNAQLLDFGGPPQVPLIDFDSSGQTSYVYADRLLSIDAAALFVMYDPYAPDGLQLIFTDTGGIPPPGCAWPCGTLKLRVGVTTSGALSGAGTTEDLVIKGRVWTPFGEKDGVLLTGRVLAFGFQNSGSTDLFNFRIAITGGELAPFYFPEMNDLGMVVTSESSSFGGSFAQNFGGEAKGQVGAVPAFVQPLVCEARIGDLVWNDVNRNGIQDAGEPGLFGVPVTLTKPDSSIIGTETTTDGFYIFENLNICGDYVVTVNTPEEFTASPSFVGGDAALDSNGSPAIVSVTPATVSDMTIDFGFYATPRATPFLTVTQGGWGSKPRGNNPGRLLADNFSLVYPAGYVVIGGTYTVRLDGAVAIQNFLPQGGKPVALTQNYVNPTDKISVLAGQVLALTLNVDFSSAGITTPGLGMLSVVSGPLAGWSVAQVLDLGNSALGGGGLPAGLTLSALNDVITKINENFPGGTGDNGYLQP